MKKIFYLFLGITLLSLSSCFKIDNWDAPGCTLTGTVIDSYTGQPLLTSQNDWQLHIWERSFTGQPGGATNYQSIPIKQDGTYENTKLFAGTYDMLPTDGPFWQPDTTKSVELKNKTVQDFKVTPYLVIDDYTYSMVTMPDSSVWAGRPGLYVKFKVKAPLLQNQVGGSTVTIPDLNNVKIFLSQTTFCGNGTDSRITISDYEDNGKGRIDVNQSWANILNGSWTYAQHPEMGGLTADQNPADAANHLSPEFDLLVPLKGGYTYYVRVGACSNIGSIRYNYSPIHVIDNIPYVITATAGGGGTISPAGVITLSQGGSQSFTFAPNIIPSIINVPDSVNVINQVLVDGVNNPTAVSTGSYTFSNVTEDHSIAVSFIKTAKNSSN